MKRHCGVALLLFLSFYADKVPAQNYRSEVTVSGGFQIIRLYDRQHRTEVAVAPALGNNAIEMKIRNKEIFWRPPISLAEIRRRAILCAVPLLAPWANRIDGFAYYANGKKYLLNRELGNLRLDEHDQPIHGLLAFSPLWEVVKVEATAEYATVTSRLAFWKYPDLLAQFPFPHELEITYRLKNGILEVKTRLRNLGTEPLPVALGYHPYLKLTDSKKSRWKVHVPARSQFVLNEKVLPTGELRPVNLPPEAPVGKEFGGVYTDLIRNSQGFADFTLIGRRQRLTVRFGPKYTVGIVWTPADGNFVCIEPMTAPTNAWNLAHRGLYKQLQSVPPNQSWEESFWIIPEGFR